MTRQLIRPGRIALAILSAVVLLVTATAGISPAAATKDKNKDLPEIDLAVSFSPDRSNAVKLNGATLEVGQKVAIFVDPVDLWAHKAKFYVNHKFVRAEYHKPFDLAGTGKSNLANLLSTDTLKLGENKVRVDVYLGWFKVKSVEAKFNVVPALPLISEIVIKDPNLSTLETALTVATNSGPIDFLGATSNPDADLTVFAPTNDAFAALGATLDDVLADPSGLLTQILAYHVLGTSESAAELIAAGSATTLQGEDITITVVNGEVFINDAKVLIADIPAKNGIVHVIDAVLVPPSLVDPGPPAKGTIGGKTSDADGSPLTGVVVDLFAANGDGTRANWIEDTTTGPDGRFSFEVDPGCYVLVFIAPEGRTWAGSNSKWLNVPVCVAAGETKGAVDATLNPAPVDPPVDDKGTIGDKVVDGQGKGEAGVVVDLFATNADGSKAGWLGDTTTDADGMYSFEVAPGCYVVVFISPDNNAFETGRFFQTHVCVAAGETRDDIDAFLKKF